MNFRGRIAAGLAVTSLMSVPVLAEEPASVADAEPAVAGEAAVANEPAAASVGASLPSGTPEASPAPVAQDNACELHVWPTNNYLGFNSGLLSGFGVVGVVADMAAHDGRVKTVKDLMRDYLGPEVQLAELEKAGYRTVLGKQDYRIVIEEPTPFNEDLKNNPALKAQVKAMNAKLKSGERMTASTNPCYAEFFVTKVFYHKAMMYGSNLFTGIVYRDYSAGGAPRVSVGSVKNPLEQFPPKTPEMVETAQIELRDAFSRDFVEWSQKKLVK